MVEFRMPSLGADMESGFLREWHVKPGDRVNRGDIIAEVETQKGIIDIEVFDAGWIGELLIRKDDKVPVGALMTHILTEQEVKSGVTPPVVAKVPEPVVAVALEHVAPPAHVRASPLARKIAMGKGIDLSTIHGTGPEGAITREDVDHAVPEHELPAQPKPAVESIRLAVAAAMSKSNREIPHYYLQTKVDMSAALEWLTEANRERAVKDRLLSAVLLIKSTAKALTDVPDFNGWWENGLTRKENVNIGFVTSLRGGGIIVPAIHDADKKSLDEIMKVLSDIIPRARAQKLRSSDLTDSTITITNLPEGSVETVFGVIYPPQVALLGFGAVREEPWAENGMLGVRPVLTISLSADHRATDGITGSRFLEAVRKYLLNPHLL